MQHSVRRTLVTLLGAAAIVVSGSPALGLPSGQTVLEPDRPGQARPALLVLLPAGGQTAAGHLEVARAAQRAAGGTRLWVAVGDVGAGPAGAVLQYELLTAQVRAAGYDDLQASDVVVAAWGDSVPALGQIARAHALAGTAALGSDLSVPDGALRVLAELDRTARVIRSALTTDRLLVLPGAGADGLRAGAAGEVLGDLVEATFADPADLGARLAGDHLVAAVRTAAELERGQVCAELQRTTADLDPADAARLHVRDRASADLVAPTAEGVAQGSFGGFLYDKAELVDDGDSATVTTNSYVPVGQPAVEVMCKTKSRSAVAQAIHGSHLHVDATPPTCADFTEATLAWSRAQLSDAAVRRSGGVTVLPDLPKNAGPEWVLSPLLVRPADPVTGRWEVQSPSLVTQLTDTDLDPRFAGNHYCKVLSPLRALELVLEDTAAVTAG